MPVDASHSGTNGLCLFSLYFRWHQARFLLEPHRMEMEGVTVGFADCVVTLLAIGHNPLGTRTRPKSLVRGSKD
jgi:hypothetical protein